MLRSTELNTFGMASTIYHDLLCRANGGYLSIKGWNSMAMRWLSIRMGERLLPGYTGFGDQLKDDEHPCNKLYDFMTRVYH